MLFQAWATKVQYCLLQKCKCKLRSADSAAGPNKMSTLGCALRCPHTLPASVLTVTVTKRLTAEITVTMLHQNGFHSLFFFFFGVPWQKWSLSSLWIPCSTKWCCPSFFPLSLLPLRASPSFSRKGCPCASPRCLLSLPFPRGNRLFFLLSFQCLPNTSTAHKPLKQRLCSTACV